MKVVLDTSAVIYLNDFRSFEEMFTVSNVIEEVKDKVSNLKLSGLKINVVEPSESAVKQVKEVAKRTGDLEKLSHTDLKVLAAAREHKLTIISDDYNIQNVAEKLGIKFISIFNRQITKLIRWKYYCKDCKKFYDDKTSCPRCGLPLIRRPEKIRKIERKL